VTSYCACSRCAPHHVAQAGVALIEMLQQMKGWVAEIPPAQQAQRFGNTAFRIWHDRVTTVWRSDYVSQSRMCRLDAQAADGFLATLLPEPLAHYASEIKVACNFSANPAVLFSLLLPHPAVGVLDGFLRQPPAHRLRNRSARHTAQPADNADALRAKRAGPGLGLRPRAVLCNHAGGSVQDRSSDA
jgi:hypothetical protein